MTLAGLGGRLVIPVVILTVIAILALAGLLWAAAVSLDNERHSIEAQLARSLLQNKSENLARLALDYSWWDQAVERLVASPDPVWADDNIGSYLAETFDITASYVLAPTGTLLVGFEDGVALNRDMAQSLRSSIATLIESAREGPVDPPEPAASYVVVDGRMAAVAVGALTPEYPGDDFVPEQRTVLVLVQTFERDALLKLGEIFALPGLAFSESAVSSGAGSVAVVGAAGTPVGVLSWTSVSPGTALLWNLGPAIAIFGGLAGAVLFLFLRNAGALLASHESLERALSKEAELNTLKSRFASMVSHELRTPLSAIAAASGLMRRYRVRMSTEEVDQELRAIEQGVADLTGLTENFLMLGRLEAGGYESRVQSVNVKELCTEAWGVVVRSLGASHRLNLTLESGVESIETDLSLLRTIVTNLLHNAVKFSPGEDRVDVHISIARDGCRLSVRDFGIGVDEEDADSLFEPFRRGHNVDGYSGSGLGLAIVRATAQQLGAQVWLDRNHGEGAKFHVQIPEKKLPASVAAGLVRGAPRPDH